jgi:putative transcriptional regulator
MKLDVARLVKALRVARGLTQEQLAHELSVTFGTINGWENRKHRPIPALQNRLIELAHAAKVPVERPSPPKSTRKVR